MNTPRRGRRRLAIAAGAVGALCAVSLAFAALSPGRQPAGGELTFDGRFHRALWAGSLTIAVSADGASIQRIQGILPANCRDRRNGRLRRNGFDGSIGIVFDMEGGPIAPDGSFAFRSKNGSLSGGLAPGTLTITGTFYGNNALGRLSGSTGRDVLYSSCIGNQPFWVRRTESPPAAP